MTGTVSKANKLVLLGSPAAEAHAVSVRKLVFLGEPSDISSVVSLSKYVLIDPTGTPAPPPTQTRRRMIFVN